MIITCGECDSSFILDDNLVKPTGSKVRCSNCKNVFVVFPAQAAGPATKNTAVAKQVDEDLYDYSNDPDLSKAVAAIDERELEFSDEELGITSLEKESTPVVKAAAVPQEKPEIPEPRMPEIPIPIPEPEMPSDEKAEPAGEESDILDFADFELEMDEEGEQASVSVADDELDLDLDDDRGESLALDDDLDLDLQLDDEEEELDFSDLERELDGKTDDTEVIGGDMTPDEADSADTVVVEELQLDLSEDDDSDGPPPLPEDDFTFDEPAVTKESETVMMVDDELDFSDLERELDGLSDEPADVDELDLGLSTEEDTGEPETIMMDGDELDFSEFELEDDEKVSGKTESKAASLEMDDEELDFSSLSDILDSDHEPEVLAEDVDEDLELDLELDLDMDSDSDSGIKAKSGNDDEEELDFSDLEDLLDDLEKADAVSKGGSAEEIDLELDGAVDEEPEAPATSKAVVHDDDELDFSDVEAMLDLDDSIDEKMELESADDDSDLGLELEMEDSSKNNYVRLGDEEDPDIELELDMGDDDQAEEDNELLELEEDDDTESVVSSGSQDTEKAFAGKDDKKKAKPKPKRKAPGRGKDVMKYIGIALLVLFILFFLYMAKNAIGQAVGVNIPISIGPLEDLRDSLAKMGVPGLSSFVAPQDDDVQGKFKLKTSGISGKVIPNSKMGDLFVITGSVQNMYSDTRNSISLVCKLFGRGGSVSQTALFYAGNVIPESELLKMDEGMIKKRLQNRLGDNGVNTSVRPNQVVPFMVVFTRLGDNLTEFSVEPAGSKSNTAP